MNVNEGVKWVNDMLRADNNPNFQAVLQNKFGEILWLRFLNEMKRTVIIDWNKPARFMDEKEKRELAKFLFNLEEGGKL